MESFKSKGQGSQEISVLIKETKVETTTGKITTVYLGIEIIIMVEMVN